MNDDRCDHVAVSPGQAMCSCTSRRVFLENLVRLQAQRICELEAALYKPRPRLITITQERPMRNGKSPLTDILPAKVRKYVYAAYALLGVVVGVWSIFGSVPDVVTNILYAIGVGLGAVAASNVRHTPPAL